MPLPHLLPALIISLYASFENRDLFTRKYFARCFLALYIIGDRLVHSCGECLGTRNENGVDLGLF